MSEDRATYKTARAYTVSKGTNEVLNIIAEFNAVLDKMHNAVDKRYANKGIIEFLDAKAPLERYMMDVLNDSIREQMSETGSDEI